jgi:putative ABC transport system ATP-binding protein
MPLPEFLHSRAQSEADQQTPVLSISELSHWFEEGNNRLQVLKGIKLSLKRGEFVALVGPSGCGKTTLLTLVAGVRAMQEGSIRVLNAELNHCNAATIKVVRNSIGMVFQSHNLIGFLSAEQNVQIAMEIRRNESFRARSLRAKNLLEAVGLGDKCNHLPAMLSGGQRQRVALARALANRPPLLVADEPTASVDQRTGMDLILLMKEMAASSSMAVLMSTHDPRIMGMADRVIELLDGVIVSG